MSFKLANRIEIRDKYSNIDQLWGPYESVEEACEAISESRRERGLTVGIISNDNLEEYWWKLGTSDGDLERKVEKVSLTLSSIGDTTISKSEGELVVVNFSIEGRSGILRGLLYLVVGNSEIFLSEIPNLGKGNNSYQISNMTNSGTYIYRIKVLDSSGSFATTNTNLEYIQYQIKYGGVSLKYNLIRINQIELKNSSTVAEKLFTCNISVRDFSFNLQGLYLADNIEGNNGIELLPCDSLGNEQESLIGNNYYFLPKANILENFDGKTCYSVLKYTEEGILRTQAYELFKLLAKDSIELISETPFKNYYLLFPSYFKFKLQTGILGISINLKANDTSDFTFDSSTVLAYNSFSLKIIPKNIKDDAVLKLDYTFVIDNKSYFGTLEIILGNILPIPEQNYYEADQRTFQREDIVFANENDIVSEEGFYKIINNTEFTTDIIPGAFLIDMYCKIDRTGNNYEYITINAGNILLGSVNEETILLTSINTDTPLGEWVQIGIGYNLYEKGNLYHAIYINGMLVKNIYAKETETIRLPITVKLKNGILVLKCLLYYNIENNLNSISPNTETTSIIYNNYKSHTNFEEPKDLPLLKLYRITDEQELDRYFPLLKKVSKKLKVLTKFGSVEDGKAQMLSDYENNPTLFRQTVDLKSQVQKQYAVLCTGEYIVNGINILDGVLIEVHTQGTSTLAYNVPNFKFTFWKLSEDGSKLEPFYPEFILLDEENYYNEYVYTAKADFMDSSHLNNTPTCNYYNTLISNLMKAHVISGSPSALTGNLDAIMGFPIIVEITDEQTPTNIGSFMLNIDKTGNSLGFEVLLNDEQLSCLSLEGTSNDNGSGASGRFIIPEGTELKIYNDLEVSNGEIISTEIDEDYNAALELLENVDEIEALNNPYIKWCKFLSDGLEYRYPDSNIYSVEDNKVTNILNLLDFKTIYRMWIWVNTSDTLSQEEYREQFPQYYNLEYCILYFIQLMIFGQTDNMGKNTMFDTWNKLVWYPRPYDLDSEAGLDNNGSDNIASFVEIKPEFSLNYDATKAEDYDWRAENYLIEKDFTDPNSGKTYKKSTILYNGFEYDRYHYSSNSSKLWINFYKNYKTLIESFYLNLRSLYNYTPESVIELCKNLVIDVLGVNLYNQDFNNKYLGNSYLRFAYGNRWYKFKKWITQRFAFCDSYFSNADSALYSIDSEINYKIKVQSPLYITSGYQKTSTTQFVVDESESFTAGSGGGTKTTVKVNQNSVLDTNLFQYISGKDMGPSNFTGLIKLDVSGNKKINNISEYVGDNLPNLKILDISESGVTQVVLPPALDKFISTKNLLNRLVIPDNCLVSEINLSNSIINDDVSFSLLPNLEILNLSNCILQGDITLNELPNLSSIIIDNATFNGNIIIGNGINIKEFNFSNLKLNGISLSGSDSQIESLNFVGARFTLNVLNLDSIKDSIKHLYFNKCEGLILLQLSDGYKIGNQLNTLSIENSSIISLGINSEKFDASFIDKQMSQLKKVSVNNNNEIIVDRNGNINYYNFTFQNTKILEIINLNWNGPGTNLFNTCPNLTSIKGSLTLTENINYLFYRDFKLETIPEDITIDTTVQSATDSFSGSILPYSKLASIIKKCVNATSFNYTFRNVPFDTNTEIDLNDLFENLQTTDELTLNGTFYNFNNRLSIPTASKVRTIIITGLLPENTKSAQYMFDNLSNSLKVPYNILLKAINIEDITGMFASNVINFYIESYNEGTNIIQQNFFPVNNDGENNKLNNINDLFNSSNVAIGDSNIFNNLILLSTCVRTFNASSGFTEDFNISDLWKNNTHLTNITGCFANVPKVYCEPDLNFAEGVKIIMGGLFGINSYNDEYPTITINLDKILNDNNLSDPLSCYYVGMHGAWGYKNGTFENRKVNIISENGIDFLSKLNGDCVKLFKNSSIITDTSTFYLNNVTRADSMFEGSSINLESGVNIQMPESCSIYTAMFKNSSILNTLPNLNSASARTLSEMFMGAKINSSINLDAEYFNICKTELENTQRMFSNNYQLESLKYSESRGLFEGCIKLNNVIEMFSNTHSLHKGIPNNLFGTTDLPLLESLEGMFLFSCVMYDVTDYHKCINSNTISPLVNLNSIKRLFYHNYSHNFNLRSGYGNFVNSVKNDSQNDVWVIDPNTFANKFINNIDEVFPSFRLDIPDIKFKGFVSAIGTFAAYNISQINKEFVDSNQLSKIRNVTFMFYHEIPSEQVSSRKITNLPNFINSISGYLNIIKTSIAGKLDYTNEEIDENLTQFNSSAYNSYYYSGFNILE